MLKIPKILLKLIKMPNGILYLEAISPTECSKDCFMKWENLTKLKMSLPMRTKIPKNYKILYCPLLRKSTCHSERNKIYQRAKER